jgi:hypothetical protein
LVELLAKLHIELLAELFAELLTELCVELLAELYVEFLAELYAELLDCIAIVNTVVFYNIFNKILLFILKFLINLFIYYK